MRKDSFEKIPPHFRPDSVDQVWPVKYEELFQSAKKWADYRKIGPASEDKRRIGLLLVDVQNTFCVPGFELYVRGRSGNGAVDDNRRLCRFIYENLGQITQIIPSLDTHHPIQIFHSIFLVDRDGRHPSCFTRISLDDIEKGVWRINPGVCTELRLELDDANQHLLDYARHLEKGGRFEWIIWPYHALLGSVGHALVSAIDEAIFFHSVARTTQPYFVKKGDHPLSESYSILGPEFREDRSRDPLEEAGQSWTRILSELDLLIIAGQAKSHCVAWTVEDLLDNDAIATSNLFLLEDCTSPVVVPGLVDFTEEAVAAFQRFQRMGVHLVRSADPIVEWSPGSLPQR